MITPAQCRAARGLVNWTQTGLAERSDISVLAIRNFESGKTSPHGATKKVLVQAFKDAGVEFIDENGGGPGVRLRG